MKFTTCLSLLSLLTLTAAVAAPVYSQSNSNPSLLSASQQRSLKALGIKIAIPQYVPQGFRVVSVRTEPCRAGSSVDANGVCRFGPQYTVVYGNARNHCFAVNATGGGLGGPSGRYTRDFNSEILGKMDVNVGTGSGEPMTAAIANTPHENVWTSYAGKSPFYSVGTTIDNRARSATTCNKAAFMTPNELIKIAQSLEFFR